MTDLSSLTADQLAEKVEGPGWGLDDARGLRGAALWELVRRLKAAEDALLALAKEAAVTIDANHTT